MKDKKRVTITDLIEKREQISKKDKVEKAFYVGSLDGTIVLQKPSRSLCVEALSMAQDESRQDEADLYMVYHCVSEPKLRDESLQKAYQCVEPFEIVEKIFQPGEIASISTECLKMAGYGDSIKAVDDLKN